MTYLNYDEIISAVQILAEKYPDLTTRITLPNLTAESRRVDALAIGTTRGRDRPTAIFVGGVHAREWVPPDALVSLAADLLEAYASGTGLRYGSAYFGKAAVAAIVEGMQIVILPCANPDGRVFSQSVDGDWRKNRRPMVDQQGHVCHGVDINRNFDVAWDFRRYFAPDAVSASADPCHKYLYVGPAAASEPETQNIVWLLDSFPGTRWFIDVHGAIPAVFHCWGLDSNQTTDPQQNFLNTAFDGLRGSPDDAYGEFIADGDLAVVQSLARTMKDAISLVAGDDYGVSPAFDLYATSGASDDYAFSRHLANPALPKILGFTMECGREFQPDETDRETVIKEVSAALVAFCGEAGSSNGHA
jgi:murein tripeptide amidase MpaA